MVDPWLKFEEKDNYLKEGLGSLDIKLFNKEKSFEGIALNFLQLVNKDRELSEKKLLTLLDRDGRTRKSFFFDEDRDIYIPSPSEKWEKILVEGKIEKSVMIDLFNYIITRDNPKIVLSGVIYLLNKGLHNKYSSLMTSLEHYPIIESLVTTTKESLSEIIREFSNSLSSMGLKDLEDSLIPFLFQEKIENLSPSLKELEDLKVLISKYSAEVKKIKYPSVESLCKLFSISQRSYYGYSKSLLSFLSSYYSEEILGGRY